MGSGELIVLDPAGATTGNACGTSAARGQEPGARTSVAAENAADLASYPTGLTVADLPDRDLTEAELEELAAAVAQQPELWSHLVAFDGEDRVYASLHRDAHVDLWLLCWTPENDTGWHDHDVSSGAVAVVSGELVENNLTLASGARETRVGAGTGVLLRPRPHPPAQRGGPWLGQRPRLQPAAVAHGPVRRQRGRRPAPGVALLRRRAAADRLRGATSLLACAATRSEQRPRVRSDGSSSARSPDRCWSCSTSGRPCTGCG